ncbi:uncharacterized protein [Halyomorpha halys]|uniref:uncharacterized protein n=1 Tax=Halyomorpha halys TaxID=286706 RepID=UPI0034D1A84C
MSKDVKNFLHANGVATSRTPPYNPEGNGQVERLNGTLWKTINLAVKTQGLKVEDWETVLQESLHAIRSLLCTTTNCTPHERFFVHQRRTANGVTLPSWFAPGPVFAKRNVKHSKYEDSVEEVELLEANPQYALIRRKDGSETTVSLRQLAPRGTPITSDAHELEEPPAPVEAQEENCTQGTSTPPRDTQPNVDEVPVQEEFVTPTLPVDTSRPRRQRRPPLYLRDYVAK